MMKLYELRTIVKATPSSPWRDVFHWDDWLWGKGLITVAILAVLYFGVVGLGYLKGWIGGF